MILYDYRIQNTCVYLEQAFQIIQISILNFIIRKFFFYTYKKKHFEL